MLDELDLFEDDRAPGPRKGRHRRRREGGAGRSLLVFVMTMVILGALGVGGWIGVGKIRDYLSPPDYPGPGTGEVTIEIRPGNSIADIANTLYNADVVASAAAFVNAAEDHPQGHNLQPGFYQLRRQMRAADALEMLLDPANRLINGVTIPEGLSNVRVFEILSEELGIPVEEFWELADDPAQFGIDDSWFTRNDGKESARTLEGFLYPATYEFGPDVTAQSALQQMVDQFMSVAEELNFQAVAAEHGLTPYEALIVASLTEPEGIPEDLDEIARVIYNRLEDQTEVYGRLNFDSTTNYWLEVQGHQRLDSSQLDEDQLYDESNPYSTHAHTGLPPGPISNPSRIALEAALNPAEGDWLYFVVVEEDGSSAFAETYAEHLQNIERCRAIGRC